MLALILVMFFCVVMIVGIADNCRKKEGLYDRRFKEHNLRDRNWPNNRENSWHSGRRQHGRR